MRSVAIPVHVAPRPAGAGLCSTEGQIASTMIVASQSSYTADKRTIEIAVVGDDEEGGAQSPRP